MQEGGSLDGLPIMASSCCSRATALQLYMGTSITLCLTLLQAHLLLLLAPTTPQGMLQQCDALSFLHHHTTKSTRCGAAEGKSLCGPPEAAAGR
jgi:hypothetical protein